MSDSERESLVKGKGSSYGSGLEKQTEVVKKPNDSKGAEHPRDIDVIVVVEESNSGDNSIDKKDPEVVKKPSDSKGAIVEVEDDNQRDGSTHERDPELGHPTGSKERVMLSQVSKCTLFLVYLILAASLALSLSRWGCLTTLTITYINATLAPGHNALLDSQLLAVGNLLAQTCRVLQFAALIYGVWKFSRILSSSSGLRVLKDTTAKFCVCENCCKKEHSPCTVHTFILLGILILYFVVTWPPPALLTTWFPEFALWHADDADQQHSSIGYTVLAWFHHISDLIIRLVMGVATRLVMVAWTSGEKELRDIEESEDSNKKKFSKMVKNYKDKGEMAAALQYIFQEWFVMAWVVYFIGVTGNTTLVLKAAFKGLFNTASHRSWFYFAHLINDIAAFLILYICGGLMNHYHRKYRETLEEVQESILSRSDVMSECIQQKANLIPSNPKYKFIPSLCCLNIPLESAGYGFTLILTGFAFVLSFVTAFTNV